MNYLESISASAGSGKTYALSLRYIALLTKGAKPHSILALTFTKKAAKEMSERISLLLDKLSLGDKTVEENLKNYGGTVEGVDFSGLKREFGDTHNKISTIDSFFNSILRKFCFYAGVRGDYSIKKIDKSTLVEMFLESLDPYMIELCAKVCYTQNISIESLFDHFGEFEGQNGELLAKFEQRDIEYKTLNSCKLSIKESVDKVAGFVNTQEKASSSALKTFEYDDFEEFFKKIRFSSPSWLQKDSFSEYLYFKKLKGIEALDSELENIKTSLNLYYKKEEEIRIITLAKLFHTYKKCKNSILKSKNALDFSDVENTLYEVLNRHKIDSEFLYFRLDARIEHILIDEFQDTNIAQYKLLSPLIEEIKSGLGQNGFRSFFIVGDKKQSIYRFRGATPSLFDEVASTLKQNYLLHNYRSGKTVVDFINRVFLQKIADYKEQYATKQGGYVKVKCTNEDNIIQSIKESTDTILAKGAKPTDIAILSFKNQDLEYIAEELDIAYEGKVPFEDDLTSKLINTQSVKIIIAALKYKLWNEPLHKEEFLHLSQEEEIDTTFLQEQNPYRCIINIIRRLKLGDQDSLKFAEIALGYESIESLVNDIPLLDTNALSKSSKGIKLQTIHKSKGLDYPFVIVVDALSGETNGSEAVNLLYEGMDLKEIIIRQKGRDSVDPAYKEFLENKKNEELEDRLNTLYVALTRAKDGLIIIQKTEKSRFSILNLEEVESGEIVTQKSPSESKESSNEVPLFLDESLGLQSDHKQEVRVREYDLDSITYGLGLHKAFEMSEDFTLLESSLEFLYNRYGNYLDRDKIKEFGEIFEEFKKSDFCRELREAKIYKEISFGSSTSNGRIDMLAIFNDKVYIIDYKSGQENPIYKEQIERYKTAINEILGLPAKGFLLYIYEGIIRVKEV